jgi:hypothetical protein
MDHSSTFGYSPRLPVSVCGTGGIYLKLRGFSWKFVSDHIRLSEDLRYYQASASLADLPAKDIPTPFNVLFRQYAGHTLLRRPIAVHASTGILTSYPSTTPFGFALGPD